MIKGIIFDVDGTLLDSLDAWKDIGNQYLSTLDIPYNPNLDSILEHMDLLEGVKYLKQMYQLKQSETNIIETIKKNIYNQYAFHIPLKDGVKEFLDNCKKKNYQLVILTAGDDTLASVALTRLQVIDYFDDVFACHKMGISKQEKESFLTVTNKMMIKLEECIVIEDAYYAIESAHEAGFYTIAIYDKENNKDQDRIKMVADEYHQSFDTIKI